MPLKTQTVEEPHLNLTPMIDIVFLLIIFLMVGFQFTKNDAEVVLDVQLPTVSDVQPLSRMPDPIVIDVPRSGPMSIRGGAQNAAVREVTLAELREFLAESKRLDAERDFDKRAVIIRGEGDGKYQRIVDVMDACKQAAFATVSLAGRPTPTDENTKTR